VNAREISPRSFVCPGGSEKMNQFGGAGTRELNVSGSLKTCFTPA
jgi:hypothetical protein